MLKVYLGMNLGAIEISQGGLTEGLNLLQQKHDEDPEHLQNNHKGSEWALLALSAKAYSKDLLHSIHVVGSADYSFSLKEYTWILNVLFYIIRFHRDAVAAETPEIIPPNRQHLFRLIHTRFKLLPNTEKFLDPSNADHGQLLKELELIRSRKSDHDGLQRWLNAYPNRHLFLEKPEDINLRELEIPQKLFFLLLDRSLIA